MVLNSPKLELQILTLVKIARFERCGQFCWQYLSLNTTMPCELQKQVLTLEDQPAVCLQNFPNSFIHLQEMRKLSNWYLFKSQKIEEGFTLTNKPSIILIALLLQKPITLRILRKGSFLIFQMEIWIQTSNLLSSFSKLNQKNTKKTKK